MLPFFLGLSLTASGQSKVKGATGILDAYGDAQESSQVTLPGTMCNKLARRETGVKHCLFRLGFGASKDRKLSISGADHTFT